MKILLLVLTLKKDNVILRWNEEVFSILIRAMQEEDKLWRQRHAESLAEKRAVHLIAEELILDVRLFCVGNHYSEITVTWNAMPQNNGMTWNQWSASVIFQVSSMWCLRMHSFKKCSRFMSPEVTKHFNWGYSLWKPWNQPFENQLHTMSCTFCLSTMLDDFTC